MFELSEGIQSNSRNWGQTSHVYRFLIMVACTQFVLSSVVKHLVVAFCLGVVLHEV